jgi:hypothetical protein
MASPAKRIPLLRGQSVGLKGFSRRHAAAENDPARFRINGRDPVFLVASFAGNPDVGVMGDRFVVGGVALAAIRWMEIPMVFLDRLGMACRTPDLMVDGRQVVRRRCFVAFHAFILGIAIFGPGLGCPRVRTSGQKDQQDDRNQPYFHIRKYRHIGISAGDL